MTLAPPAPPAALSRRERMRAPVLTIGGLAAATLALRLRDPHQQGSWGICPLAAMGVYCPGCGGLRAVNDLTHGDLAAAASSNLLLVVAMPFVVLLLGRWAWDRWRGVRRRAPETAPSVLATAAFIVLALGFTVLRNLSAGAWLAP